MKKSNTPVLLFFLSMYLGCTDPNTLPILGETSIDPISGRIIYYQAPEFQLTNQSNLTTSQSDFDHKIKVVDFFFTRCPTICPVMTDHLKLVEKAFKEENRVAIISYSIDAKNDTPDQLKNYSQNHEIDTGKWTFLTGDSAIIFELSKEYKVRAFKDNQDNQESLLHDGTFVLVDGKRRIRGYYNGLSITDTERLILDIRKLLKIEQIPIY